MSRAGLALLLALVAPVIARPAAARSADALWLPNLFGEHMVLQHGRPVPLWGLALPGHEVAVLLDGEEIASATAPADEDGRWHLQLPPRPPSAPHVLEVITRLPGDATPLETRRFGAVAFGEVWIVAGGTNAAWPLRLTPDVGRVGTGSPDLRFLPVPARVAQRPQDDVAARWSRGLPDEARDVSALAWFFGSRLQQALQRPVGVIVVTRNLTTIAPWIPEAGYAAVPGAAPVLARLEQDTRAYHDALRVRLDALDAWLAATTAALEGDAPLPPAPDVPRHPLTDPHAPTGLFLGSIAALSPLPVAGVVWYQGERDVGDEEPYAHLLPALVLGWRDAFGHPGLPFVVVQLPPHDYRDHRATEPFSAAPDPLRLPRFWAAQQRVLELPHTSLAVVHDGVDPADAFPPDKRPFGERTARLALAEVYGLDLAAHGPVYARRERDGARLRLTFHHAEGLATRDGLPPDHFELRDTEGVWHAAEAELDGDTLWVASSRVPEPTGVRLGWHQQASPNLVNAAGLPARAFVDAP